MLPDAARVKRRKTVADSILPKGLWERNCILCYNAIAAGRGVLLFLSKVKNWKLYRSGGF